MQVGLAIYMMGSIKTKMDERSIIILWSHKPLHRAHRTALIAQKMNFFFVLTVLFAGIATANAACDPADSCKYDCHLIGKDFYGSDISCGYNLAQDWKACCKDWINEKMQGVSQKTWILFYAFLLSIFLPLILSWRNFDGFFK